MVPVKSAMTRASSDLGSEGGIESGRVEEGRVEEGRVEEGRVESGRVEGWSNVPSSRARPRVLWGHSTMQADQSKQGNRRPTVSAQPVVYPTSQHTRCDKHAVH